ncbi:MAG: hypothetical protein KME19_09190 [Microcoleus vaginatus WJT46-NPBG5]|jgi:hypothetical protein|nr:hypothetical protein [Microcoleus vaginatus WJT46-NPBG5]
MGLMVHSLSEFPVNAERDYYLYVLRGSWDSDIERALQENFPSMADAASRTKSAVIFGTEGRHFQNEVFSWHRINGEVAEPLLPALLITTIHPAKFQDENDPFWGNRLTNDHNDHMVLISLKEKCATGREAIELIRQIFEDIKVGQKLKDFEVVKSLNRKRSNAFMDGLVLRPTFMGFGFDLKTIPKIMKGE